MKLSCCMIVRDDASTLRACLESIRPHVDELIIVDTGSVDDSPDIAKEFADAGKWELFLGCNDDEGRIADFAMARNHSFSLATGDWVVWFDADDIVRGGEHLRALCKEATADNHTWLFPYEYARDDAGNVICLQLRERLMRNPSRLTWQSPVHEFCGYAGELEGSTATVATDRVVVEHHARSSTKAREPGRNLRILQSYVERAGESDIRALYYLGVEYAQHNDLGQSLRYLRRYADLANWDDEKCKALLMLGEHYRNLGDHDTAIQWTEKALITKSWPEPYFALGRSFYAMAKRGERPDYNYRRAAFFIARGLELPTDVVLFANPMERHAIHQFLNVCYNAVGDLDKAIESCEQGLRGLPGDEMLTANLADYIAEKLRRAVIGATAELQKRERISEAQATLIRATLKGELRLEMADQYEAANEPAPSKLEPQPAAEGKLDIALFLGPALERWSPDTWAEKGMGGSETMAWEMARRLRKLGHRIRFYADCTPAQEGIYEGVEWVQWQRFKGVQCDVLIASRAPFAIDDEVNAMGVRIGGCKYKAALLWVHDVHVGDMLTMRRLQRFDRILCLSQWHKAFFRSSYAPGGVSIIPEAKVVVTRNGVDLTRFDGEETRVPHRAIYSSSPDRGLLAAVLAWPKVRERVPDAELHAFYGFYNWEESAKQANDQASLGAIAHLKQLCRTTKGVVMRDRVNQRELAREFMRAGVWLYPTWFSETSCITAMEAQAAGCRIVTSPIAALTETVGKEKAGGFGYMLEAIWDYPNAPDGEFIDEVAGATVAGMTEPVGYGKVADRFSLNALAYDWDEMLLQLHGVLVESVVPKFVDVKGAAE